MAVLLTYRSLVVCFAHCNNQVPLIEKRNLKKKKIVMSFFFTVDKCSLIKLPKKIIKERFVKGGGEGLVLKGLLNFYFIFF